MARKEEPEFSTSSIIDGYLQQALQSKASDVHIEPENDIVRVRFRVDGVLQEIQQLSIAILDNLISRIKVLAQLDIAESRIPQDGRFQFGNADLRVSTFPTTYGECAVIRVLDQSKLLYSFDQLGLNQQQEEAFASVITRPYGLVLVTGPTGAGKTTTLFSILNQINSMGKCIVTLEDPPEYHLPIIRQTQIDPSIGFDFAQGLRSLFRQNPDVIMVGEIRDSKTAEIAVQAALTGHLVLSTLHTNDSVGALIRLREMGLEKFMITTATAGIIAQRLIRTICPDCKEEYQPAVELVENFGLANQGMIFYHGKGCETCHDTGFQGRIGIFEVLKLTPEINKLVYQDANGHALLQMAIEQGMQTLKMGGIVKIKDGITTLEEVMRVIQ